MSPHLYPQLLQFDEKITGSYRISYQIRTMYYGVAVRVKGRNWVHLLIGYSARFQFLSFSRVCCSFLRYRQFVFGSGNGNIHDYIIKHNKTKRNGKLETGQCIVTLNSNLGI